MSHGSMPPHWMDSDIQSAIQSKNPQAIASAIAQSPRIIEAIQKGLDSAEAAARVGATGRPTDAQFVRVAVLESLCQD